jgi:hypothetical protein
MCTQNDYVVQRIHKDAYDRAYRESEKIRALREAGLIRPNRVAQFAWRGAGALGRLLVSLGQRLEKVEATNRRAFSSQARFGNA